MSMILCLIPAPEEELAQLLADPEGIFKFIEEDREQTDLDKAWHGIHFLLAGSAWEGPEPASFLVSGGTPVGEHDVGYGPAKVLSPAEVKAFSGLLESISVEAFDTRFDAKKLMENEIYPSIWERDLKGTPDGRPYLLEYYTLLKEFCSSVAARGLGLVIYLG